MNKKVIKLAMSYFAMCQAMENIMTKLAGTSLYKHKIKHHTNELYKIIEKDLDRITDNETEENVKTLNEITEMVETMVQVIEEKDLGTFVYLLKEYQNGGIRIVPDNKHSKMLNQMQTI